MLDPGGLVGDPLDVTSDWEHDDEYWRNFYKSFFFFFTDAREK
jgi:hypothetical protein